MSGTRERPLSRHVAALLDARRHSLGITQRALADATGISQTTVSRHLQGDAFPIDSLDLYCRALELSIVDVIADAVKRQARRARERTAAEPPRRRPR